MSHGANIFFLYDPADAGAFDALKKHLGRAVRKMNTLRQEYQIGLESPPPPVPLDLVGRSVDALWYELRNALNLRDLDPYDKEEHRRPYPVASGIRTHHPVVRTYRALPPPGNPALYQRLLV